MCKQGWLLASACLVASLPAYGADEDAEKVLKQMLQTVEDLGTQMKQVTDKESAVKGLPKIKELIKQFNGLKDKSEKLKLAAEAEGRLLKQYEKKLSDAGEKVGQELKRLREVEPAKEIVTEVETFVSVLGTNSKDKKKQLEHKK
jgi:hypothetical protein